MDISGLVVFLIENAFPILLDKAIKSHEKRAEYKSLQNRMIEWVTGFLSGKEGTILCGGLIAEYLKNYNVFEHYLRYYFFHDPQIDERSFLEERNRLIREYLLGRDHSLTHDDKQAIKEFTSGLLSVIKEFHLERIEPEIVPVLYTTAQILENQSEIKTMLQKQTDCLTAITAPDIHFEALQPRPEFQPAIYSAPADMIQRKISPYKELQDPFALLTESKDIFDTCVREKHIIMLGEAGSGKTIALCQLAAQVSGSEYFPVFFRLDRYTTQSIEEIIRQEYAGIEEFRNVFLIFDAYDEIQSKDLKDFAKKLNDFVIRNPETICLVSSRTNFYSFSDDEGKGGTFKDFSEYGLAPISNSDIREYLSKDGVDAKQFFDEIERNHLAELMFTPFYLCELKKLYKSNNHLPEKTDLMEQIIRARFKGDLSKFATTTDALQNEAELMDSLEELAFSIQFLSKTGFKNIEYTDLYREEKKRALISFSGIFGKDDEGNWRFEHNNFREYLAAKYLLRLSVNEIRKTICGPEGLVLDSWVNTLSFWVLLQNDLLLFDLLPDGNEGLLTRFEKSRIDIEKRTEIAIRIMNDCAAKNIRLYHIGTPEEIAQFGCSEVFVRFLISQVDASANRYALSNTLRVLSELPELFGIEDPAQKALFALLQSSAVQNSEKNDALRAISSLHLQSPEITDWVLASFEKNEDHSYRSAVLDYLYRSECFEAHIDLFIQELAQSEGCSDDIGSKTVILKVFAEVKSHDALCKIIVCLSHHQYHFSRTDEYAAIITNAISTYQKGDHSLLQIVTENAVIAELFNPPFFQQCIRFFDVTESRVDAFMQMAEIEIAMQERNAIFAMERIADEKCYQTLLFAYEKEPVKYESIVRFFSWRLDTDPEIAEKYREALLKNGVVIHPKEPPFDYEKERMLAEQIFFDSLFVQNRFCTLADELVCTMGNPSMSFEELSDTDFNFDYGSTENYRHHEVLLHTYYALSVYKDKSGVSETLKNHRNWDSFIIENATRFLYHRTDYVPNEQQIAFFEAYCKTYFENTDISHEIANLENGGYTYTYDLSRATFLASRFGFDFEKPIYLKMLSVPYFLFDNKKDAYTNSIPQYLLQRLTKEEILNRIGENISSENLCRETVDMYLIYCAEQSYDGMVDIALEICAGPAEPNNWRKHYAFDYLLKIKGYSFVYRNLLSTEDDELFGMIVHKTLDKKDPLLKEKLEEKLKADPNDTKFLYALIFLNSIEGLKRYRELTKEKMKPADESTGLADSATEMLSHFSNIGALADFGELRKILFTDGFEDRRFFGLWNGLYRAYSNLAEIDYEKVRAHLSEAVLSENISDEEKNFCNTLLEQLRQRQNAIRKETRTLRELKSLLKAHSAS